MNARKNIAQAWVGTTPADIAAGTRAYLSYHHGLRRFAKAYGFGFVQTVEAFVALSPNNDYHGNLRSLASVMWALRRGQDISVPVVSTYKACGVRAWGYLSGEVSFADTVAGPKIISFRDNILRPETSTMVTVDGHMLCIGLGQDVTMKQAGAALSRDRTLHGEIVKAVQTIARANGLPVPSVQAALWFNRKRRLGIKSDGQLHLFEGDRMSDVPDPVYYPPFNLSGAALSLWTVTIHEAVRRGQACSFA